MTWGYPSNLDDGLRCLRCKHLSTCRAAIRALQSVKCEGQPARGSSRFAGALPPGAEFAVAQLAGLTGLRPSTIGEWIRDGRAAGELIPIGKIRQTQYSSKANVYRYQPPLPVQENSP